MSFVATGSRSTRTPRRLAALAIGAFVASLVVVPISPVLPGGGAVVEASTVAPWLTAEEWYLKLVNCTRTGGWVRSDGSCAGYGSGRYSKYVRPLKLSTGISRYVARPWAKYLAINGQCTHGDPGARLRRAGYTSYRWGENIGCRNGYSSVRAAVLQSHLYFQREKSWNGGHWRNIKNAAYTYIGIGIWHTNGRTRLVTDFYRPG